MAPNGTSRKTAGAAVTNGNVKSKSKSTSFFKPRKSDNVKPVKVKDDVTKKLPKAAKPGTWDRDLVNGSISPPASTTPTINRIPSSLASSFPTGKPLGDFPDIIKCNHCKRPVLRHSAKRHIEDCLAKKQEKQRKKKEAKDARDAAARAERGEGRDSETPEAEEVIGGLADGGPGGNAGKTTAGKKRKAEDADGGREGGKKKKKRDDPGAGLGGKVKAPRPKAPVDVEKQCGVDLPNGGQCARSLTCKSHSMGAKRAVPGRSAPYDKLLADYQRKNQAKLQKAAMEALEPNADDELTQSGPIDSDEEKDLVMAAIARSSPRPLYQRIPMPLKKKYQMVRMKEMMGNALGGRGGLGLFKTTPREDLNGMNGLGSAGLMNGNPAMAGDGAERRMSAMTAASRMPSGGMANRKPSVA